MESSSTVAHHL